MPTYQLTVQSAASLLHKRHIAKYVAVHAQVFSGDLDESVRHEQLLLEGEIMRMLKLLDISINHQVCALQSRC